MITNEWFIYDQGRVNGPFSTEVVKAMNPAPQSLIWGRGMTEWYLAQKWLDWIEKESIEKQTQEIRQSRQWRVKIVDQDHGPLPYSQLIDLLKGRENFENVWVWTEGYREWQDVFGFHKLMDDLGLGRRSHPRVPVAGQVEIKAPQKLIQAKAMSISEGGMGIADVTNLNVGEEVYITLKSNKFMTPISALAEILYIENNSFAGVKFKQISSETKSLIIEYVKNELNAE